MDKKKPLGFKCLGAFFKDGPYVCYGKKNRDLLIKKHSDNYIFIIRLLVVNPQNGGQAGG
jgi:hypothetical protein